MQCTRMTENRIEFSKATYSEFKYSTVCTQSEISWPCRVGMSMYRLNLTGTWLTLSWSEVAEPERRVIHAWCYSLHFSADTPPAPAVMSWRLPCPWRSGERPTRNKSLGAESPLSLNLMHRNCCCCCPPTARFASQCSETRHTRQGPSLGFRLMSSAAAAYCPC